MFLFGMGALIPPSAQACVAPNCRVDVRFPLPEKGKTVPANIPGLVTVPPLLESVDPTTVRLRLLDGPAVPSTVTTGAHQTQVLVPNAPLVPGTWYRIEAKGVCQFQETRTQSATFFTGPALPLPTTAGTLTADPPTNGAFPLYEDSSCGSRWVRGDSTTLRFTPSPELVPFMPWVHWTVEVDGQPWSYAKHGGLTSTGEDDSESYPYEYNRRLLLLYTVCGYAGCGASHEQPPNSGLAPGWHRATLTATLEQASLALPPVSVDFELPPCEARFANMGAGVRGCADGGPVDPLPLPPPLPESGDSKKGCSQTGGGLTVLGLLATVRLWRGRSSRRANA
ncbi:MULTISPECIES: hypothetical protein [Corallococcus]|uniref:hypothetical protein n=1 Tax=Corallococcus TaxID=83461 RepID=UPI001F37E04B|nr:MULTISPECIES: hypothetical protein [Corallococcus]